MTIIKGYNTDEKKAFYCYAVFFHVIVEALYYVFPRFQTGRSMTSIAVRRGGGSGGGEGRGGGYRVGDYNVIDYFAILRPLWLAGSPVSRGGGEGGTERRTEWGITLLSTSLPYPLLSVSKLKVEKPNKRSSHPQNKHTITKA